MCCPAPPAWGKALLFQNCWAPGGTSIFPCPLPPGNPGRERRTAWITTSSPGGSLSGWSPPTNCWSTLSMWATTMGPPWRWSGKSWSRGWMYCWTSRFKARPRWKSGARRRYWSSWSRPPLRSCPAASTGGTPTRRRSSSAAWKRPGRSAGKVFTMIIWWWMIR